MSIQEDDGDDVAPDSAVEEDVLESAQIDEATNKEATNKAPRAARVQLGYIVEAPADAAVTLPSGEANENTTELYNKHLRSYVEARLAGLGGTSSSSSPSSSSTSEFKKASQVSSATVLFRVGPPGSVMLLGESRFLVDAVELRNPPKEDDIPSGQRASAAFSVADTATVIFLRREVSPTLERIRVLPYSDSLPTAYAVSSIFEQYVSPYFRMRPFRKFGRRDQFVYQGVRFRVVRVHPEGAVGRVGMSTDVHWEGRALEPKLRDLLGTELQRRLQVFPGFMQTLLAHYIWQSIPRDQLQPGDGLTTTELDGCEIIKWKEKQDAENACTVCLSAFEEGDTLRKLACRHMFHRDCVDTWLNRSPFCPMCKQPAAHNALPGGDE